MFGPFIGGHELSLARIESVPMETRRHMHMIVPNVLAARWLVVLSRRYAITRVNKLECQSNRLCNLVYLWYEMHRQVKDILKVFVRNDDDIPMIVRPLMGADESSHSLIAIDDIVLNCAHLLILNSLNQQTEWANIV